MSDHDPTKVEERRDWTVAVIIASLIALVIIAISLLAPQDSRDDSGSRILTSVTAATTPPTTVAATSPPLTEPAQVTTTAERVIGQIQITSPPPPPFDPVAYVNSLAYCWLCPLPAEEAWRIVGLTPAPLGMGWSQETVDARWEFGFGVMGSESAYCWNAVRWSWPNTGVGDPCTSISTNNCVQGSSSRKGCHDDAGFGQLTSSTRSPRDALCGVYGICTAAQTIADPWTSMKAFQIVLDDMGKQPWCFRYSNGRLSHHITNGDCATWPG